jgi:hypothetical protein
VATTHNNSYITVHCRNGLNRMQFLFISLRASNSSNTFNNEVTLSQSSSFVKATDINLPGKRNAVWFSAKNLLLDQLDNGVVYSHRQLHWEFRGDHIGQNKDATKQDLITGSVRVFQTLSKNIVTRSKSELEENQQVKVHFRRFN